MVDTGAGECYLVLGNEQSANPFHTSPTHCPIILANGSPLAIREKADVHITIGNKTRSYPLMVLPQLSTDGATHILFGRDLIESFQLRIDGSSRISMDKLLLYDSRRDRVCHITTCGYDELEDIEGVVEIQPPPRLDPSDRITLDVPPSVKAEQIRLLEKLVAEGPVALPFCPQVSLKLRRLRPSEPTLPDTPEQAFCFEIDAAPPTDGPLPPARMYARSRYLALPANRRSEFDELVQEYVKAGWWQPADRQHCRDVGKVPANIFGVCKKDASARLRLVADFRQLNQFFPASTSMPQIAHSLLSLSLRGEEGVVVGDLKGAFLRLRLRSPLWVHTGAADYLTSRLNFGLSFGPEGLRRSAGRLWESFVAGSSSACGVGGLFVDDWYLSLPPTALRPAASQFLSLLGLTGFECIRSKFQSIPDITATVLPTTITATDLPTTITATDSPTTITATDSPTTITATDSPTTITATDSPTTITATDSPTTITATDSHTTISATDMPTTITADIDTSIEGHATQLEATWSTKRVKLFNCGLYILEALTIVDCCRQSRLAACSALLEEKVWTKTSVFALAGSLGYDPTRQHPTCRLVADLLRSVIGAWPDWHGKICLSGLSKHDGILFGHLLEWARELCRQAPTACLHRIPVDRAGSDIMLLLETDSSLYGHGFALHFRSSAADPWVQVQADCSAWKKAQFAYSINRLEAIGLFEGLRKTALFLNHLRLSEFPADRKRIHLAIKSDNSTAIAWATKGAGSMNLHSLELRQIHRLAEALCSEMEELRRLCYAVELTHIPGSDNSSADSLSRILYRPVPGCASGATVGSLYRDRYTKVTPLSVKRITVSPATSICERICASSFDIGHAFGKFSFVRRCLRHWVSRSKLGGHVPRAGTQELSPLENDLVFTLQDTSLFLTNAQSEIDRSTTKYTDCERLLCLPINRFNGSCVMLKVIPKSHPAVADRVFRFYHRLNGHRGVRHTLADCVAAGYHLEGGIRVGKAVTQNCLVCAKKNALTSEPVLPPHTAKRELTLPVFSRVAIDHIFCRHLASRSGTLLSCMCIDTGYLQLFVVPDLSTDATVHALAKLSHRFSVQFRLVHSDNFASLRSTKFMQALQALGHTSCEVSHTPVGASQCNPVERLHREVWSVLRSRKFCARITACPGDPWDEICYIINCRPLGFDSQKLTLITPAALAFGSLAAAGPPRPIDDRLHGLRDYFYNSLFDEQRRRFHSANIRRAAVHVNQLCLTRNQEANKLDYPVDIGKIVAIGPKGISVLVRGQIFLRSSTQVIPLAQQFQPPSYTPGGACSVSAGIHDGTGSGEESNREELQAIQESDEPISDDI